jgi:hypothetical protein
VFIGAGHGRLAEQTIRIKSQPNFNHPLTG